MRRIRRIPRIPLWFLASFLVLQSNAVSSAAEVPTDGSGAYATGT